MDLQVFDSTGTGSVANIIAAIDYSILHGAKISNNSWALGGPSTDTFSAIEDAQQAGQIFVVAAGNGGANQPSYPALYTPQLNNIVSVAAITNTGQLWSNSNYGASTVTLAAPGVEHPEHRPRRRLRLLHRHLPGRAVRHGDARPGVGSAPELDLPTGHRAGDFHGDAAGEPQGQNDHRRHRQRGRRRRLRRPAARPPGPRPVRGVSAGRPPIPSTASSSPSIRSSTRPSSPRRTSTSPTRPAKPCP